MKTFTSFLIFALFSAGTVAAAEQPTACHPGVKYLARGNYKAALQALATVPVNSSTPAALLHSRALAELVNGNLEEAARQLDLLILEDPSFEEALFNRGVVRLKQGRFTDAIADFARVHANDRSPLRARAAYHAALAADAGKRKGVEGWLRTALELDPSLADALLYLGVVLERNGRFEEAGTAYKEYLVLQPESVVALLRFGVTAHRAGFFDTARASLQRVVDRAPSSAEAAEARKLLVMWE